MTDNYRYLSFLCQPGWSVTTGKLICLKTDPEEKTDLLNNDDPVIKDQPDMLWEAVCSFPEIDSDPRYTPLIKQDWDKEITVESQIWKKNSITLQTIKTIK